MRKEFEAASTSSTPNPPQTPFDRCLVDGDPATAASRRRSRRKALGVSLVIEGALLTTVVLVPLMTSVAQPHLRPTIYVPIGLARPHRSSPGIKPAQPDRNPWKKHEGIIYANVLEPGHPVPPAVEDPGGPAGPDSDGLLDVSGPDTPVMFDLHPANPIAPPSEEPKKNSEKRTVKMSAGVQEAQLISRVEPCYPQLATQIHLQGTVVLHAVISREGRITSLEVLSGHPLLVRCALDAVQQWRYRPTILNGEPVEVDTTITVIFHFKE